MNSSASMMQTTSNKEDDPKKSSVAESKAVSSSPSSYENFAIGRQCLRENLRSIAYSRASFTLFLGFNPSCIPSDDRWEIKGLNTSDLDFTSVNGNDNADDDDNCNNLGSLLQKSYKETFDNRQTNAISEVTFTNNMAKLLNEKYKPGFNTISQAEVGVPSAGKTKGNADLLFVKKELTKDGRKVPLGLVEVGLLNENEGTGNEKLEKAFRKKMGQASTYLDLLLQSQQWKTKECLLLCVLVATRDCSCGRFAVFACEPKNSKEWRMSLLWRTYEDTTNELSQAFRRYLNGVKYLNMEGDNLAATGKANLVASGVANMAEVSQDGATMAEEASQDGATMAEEDSQDGANMAEETSQDGANMAEEDSEDGVNMAEETSQDGANMAEETSQDGADTAEETSQDGANTAEETGKDAVNTAEETVSEGASTMEETIQDGANMAGETRSVAFLWEYLGPNCTLVILTVVEKGEKVTKRYVIRVYDNRGRHTSRTPEVYKIERRFKLETVSVLVQKDNELDSEETIEFGSDVEAVLEANDKSMLFYKWNSSSRKGGKIEVIGVPYHEGGHVCQNGDQAHAAVLELERYHQQNLVHGDLRGYNIVFSIDGKTVHIIDWDYGGPVDTKKYPVGYERNLIDGSRIGYENKFITKENDVRDMANVLGGLHTTLADVAPEIKALLESVLRNAGTLEESKKIAKRLKGTKFIPTYRYQKYWDGLKSNKMIT